jgi:S1-C subfamily serine protease
MFEEKGHEGGVVVDNILFGSPAYMCRQISKGDYIVAVDGMELYSSDAIATALQGSQVPGTTVRINIQRPDTVCRSCLHHGDR